jgi:hypothetical protein
VEHFWDLHQENQPDGEKVLKGAVYAALGNADPEILEYLLARPCPWDATAVDELLRTWVRLDNWTHWRPTCEIAIQHKLAGNKTLPAHNLLHIAFHNCDWAFLKMAEDNGYDVQDEATSFFSRCGEPNGPDVEHLQAFFKQTALPTDTFATWLTIERAIINYNPVLLKAACDLHPEDVTNDLTKVAAEEGDLETLKWLHERIGEMHPDTAQAALQAGQMACMLYATSTRGPPRATEGLMTSRGVP